MPRIARLITVVLTTLTALTGAGMLTAPAHAEGGYTFWAYYHLTDGTWVPSTKGADGHTPDDGDVEGFRYATTTESDFDRPPRALPPFAEICAGTQAGQDQKRIGIVLDYGTAADAPEGDRPPRAEAACAVVPADATTQQALESVEPLRVEDGLICGIGGYPSAGCAEQVESATVPAREKPVELALPGEGSGSGSGADAGMAAMVAAAVVALGGGGFLLARRRRAS